MTAEKDGEGFRPSGLDLFYNWLDRIRIRPWRFFTVLGAGLILIQLLFLWLDSGSLAGELLPVIFFNALAVPYLMALIRLLDHQAIQALRQMRPILKMSDGEFERYNTRIADMPFLPPLLAGLAMTFFVLLFPLVASEPERYAALGRLSSFTVVYHVVDKLSAFLFGVALYHTIRQLGLVHLINATYLRINVFQLRPVQAFSRLTGATALGLVVFFYGWMLINPELLADPAVVFVSLLFTALAILVFVWPLWGVHRLMVAEKEQALLEIELKFEAVFADFNKCLAENDQAAAQELNGTIMALEVQHNKVSSVPTWPWRSETAQIVLTAVALPVLLMIIQFLVQRSLLR